MTDHDALLAAILAQPEEDTLRLAYADWMEENGQPERAEFIRVQVELARMKGMDPDCPRASDPDALKANLALIGKRPDEFEPCYQCWPKAGELRRRERELLDSCHESRPSRPNWGLWSNPLCDTGILIGRPWMERMDFTRGFVSHVTCSWSDWHMHADVILARQPIERVKFTVFPPEAIVEGDFYRDKDEWGEPMKSHRWPRIEFELPPVVNGAEWGRMHRTFAESLDLIAAENR